MTQKHIVLIVIFVLLGGLAIAAVNQFKKETTISTTPITPTPTPQQLIFDQPTQQPTRQIKQYPQFPGVFSPEDLKNKKVILQTNKGVIEFEVYPEATKAASNFIFLTQEKFYDGLIFHRVEPGFVIQGGDPLGTGSGGPGYRFEDEPVTRTYDKGIVAMANSGPDTNGSQFFIMLADRPDLPSKYTIFGKVIKGIEVVESIRVGDGILRAVVSSR